MSAPLPPGLNPELLDDFFAEADEHLLNIRRALMQLEASVGRSHPDPKFVEELFRDFHSFKGISALAGLAPAESIAHATEDFLRLLKSGQTELSASGLEVLTASTQKLEHMVADFRAQKPLPGYESLLADLKEHCQTPAGVPATSQSLSSAVTDPDLLAKVEEVKSRGQLLFKFTFGPSQELDKKGINLQSIREQLGQMGEILKCTPLVQGQGGVRFEFLVASAQAPADILAWEARGVAVQSADEYEPESKPSLPAAGTEEETHSPFLAPSHVVRVDLKRLDDPMRITGEMVIQRSRLESELAHLAATGVDLRAVQEVSASLGRSLRELREAITRVRLVPVAEIFARMPFVVRDLARLSEKKVRLKLEGQETAVDKYLIEKLKDPFLHLVRNAFSHGVETPEERRAQSKSPEATIELRASTVGDTVILQVRDDGRGINPKAIAQHARKMGLAVPEILDNPAILNILCSSGFSTRDDADRAAGRGVGMAVVHSTVRELGGTLTLESEEGKGTQFTLRLPLTLAIIEALIVSAAGQTCAVPQNSVTEVFATSEEEIQWANGIEVVSYRSGVLPVVRLAGLFRLQSAEKSKRRMLVVTSERGSVGLLTEHILGQREVVVRTLQDPLIQVAGIVGATELGDGKPVLILDSATLTAGHVRPGKQARRGPNHEVEASMI